MNPGREGLVNTCRGVSVLTGTVWERASTYIIVLDLVQPPPHTCIVL